MEIEAYTLVEKEPVFLRFNSNEFGIVGANFEMPKKLATTHGIALEITGKARFQSARLDFEFWYLFKAQHLGHAANLAELDDKTIAQWVKKNPDLVCRSWAEIEEQHAHRNDFKRTKRPFVRVFQEWGILWEYYPKMARLGVYIGSRRSVVFYGREMFKFQA